VFGKVVAGQDVVSKIANAPRGSGDRPNSDIAITAIEVFRSPTKPA
jgi:cyclophilin family peptidyl-prolyl cis-trans isomerase